MESQQGLIDFLKQNGACTIPQLIEALGISENAVRHHLKNLQAQGFLTVTSRRRGLGRPAKLYELTNAAEGLFPKRYEELLGVLLEAADENDLLKPLLEAVTNRFVKDIGKQPHLDSEQRLMDLFEKLDYGEMLAKIEHTESGWEVRAYNCVYKSAGCKVEAVCDLLPNVITKVTDLPAERPFCQRDGEKYCTFSISKF